MPPTTMTLPNKGVNNSCLTFFSLDTSPRLCYIVITKRGLFIMCKEHRTLKIAAKVAEQSGYGKFRHGAVLIKGGSVMNVSPNRENHTAFGQRFRTQEGIATQHAETSCVLGLNRSVTSGGTMYVARVNRKGQWRMSKPCSMCHEVMKFVGIKKVVYTIAPNEWGTYKIEEQDATTIGY